MKKGQLVVNETVKIILVIIAVVVSILVIYFVYGYMKTSVGKTEEVIVNPNV